jgi:hypothetical protein
MNKTIRNKSSERGSALVYILIAIALLGALTVTFMEPSSQQTTSQGSLRSATQIQSQIDVIRSAIQECVLKYPNGDSNIPNAASESEEGARQEYPIRPNSAYYNASPASTVAATAGQLAKDIRCPGQLNGPETKDHEKIFAGASGKFLPAPPDLFEDWQYYNGPDGVYFWTRTTKTDAYLVTALEKLDEKFSECEADITTAGGSAVNLDGDAQTQCPANNICFRVWMVANTATRTLESVDTGCD